MCGCCYLHNTLLILKSVWKFPAYIDQELLLRQKKKKNSTLVASQQKQRKQDRKVEWNRESK